MFSFKTNKVNLDECLGKGKFGKVYPYQRNKDDKKWVIKKLKVSHRDLPAAIEEIVLGFRCKHPNIISAKGFDLRPLGLNFPRSLKVWENFEKWDVIIKLPRMKDESLLRRMNNHKTKNESIPEEEILQIFYEVASGLKYLHENKIAHRDLKPDNILFTKENVAVLSDIGLAKFTEDETGYSVRDMSLPKGYTAPEILPNIKFKKGDLYSADIWSLGIVMLQVCSLPGDNNRNDSSMSAEQKEEGLKQDINKLNYSQFLKDLLLQMLRAKPQDRINIKDLWKKLDEKLNKESMTTSMVIEDQSLSFQKEEEKNNQENNSKSERSTTIKSSMQVEESKGEPLDSEDKMIQNGRLKPGEYYEWEENDREASLLSVRNEIKKGYEKLFDFDSDSKQLKITTKRSAETKNLTDQVLGDLFEKLTSEIVDKNCRKFKAFSLSLDFCSGIKGDSFSKLFGSQQLELTNFELDLKGTSINKTGLKELTTQIKNNLQSLENLSIHFPSQVNGEGVENLATKVLPNLTNLKQIELKMSRAKLSDTEIKEIAKHIADLDHLQKLQLDLNGSEKLTEAGLKDLFLPIVSSCKKLQHLDLNFSNCPKLNVSDLKESTLPMINNLHHLNLNFSQCSKIRDAGLNEIANHILPNLKNLKHLNLNYSQCKISDDGLFKLIEQICLNLPGLEHLLLGFAGSPGSGGMITGEGLLKVVDPMKSHLKNLQTLHVDFEYCNQSVKEVKSKVEESLKGILKDVQGFNIK